jgi:hypothetical protein
MLDGYVARRLNRYIIAAIRDFKPGTSTASLNKKSVSVNLPLTSHTFTTTTLLEQQVQRVREQVMAACSIYKLATLEVSTVNESFFRHHMCPPKSGMQMVIQLACRRYFGRNLAAFETVSLSHFLKGRVEISHVLWPAVARFCTAAIELETSSTAELRALFFAAVKTHAGHLMRATRGQGSDRHLLSLLWSVEEGEELPALFASPLFENKSRPQKIMTDCLVTESWECGSLLSDPDALWIHYEPKDDMYVLLLHGNSYTS